MRSFELRAALLLMVTLGLSACPSDDSGDEGADTAAVTTTETAGTDTGTSTSPGEEVSTGEETTAGMADSTTGEAVLGDIEVTVIYEGTQTGTVNVVAITEFPPMGPPSAIASDMAPVFPWMGTLTGLEPGEYIIFATLDVGGNNPTIPGEEDPQSDVTMPVTVTVDGPGPFQAEVTLVDP